MDQSLLKDMTDISFGQSFQTDSSPGSSSDEVRLSNVTASSSLERRMMVKQFYKEALVRCSKYQEGRPVCSSESFDISVAELDSVDLCGNRFAFYWTGMLVQLSDFEAFQFLCF